MTTQDTLMVVDATEKVLVDMDKHTAIDAFLDQARHVCEHGGSLTELGRLILEERLQMKARATAENDCIRGSKITLKRLGRAEL
jgi:hypothetical protein